MRIPIDEIVIKQRVRQDLGDISLLMESMRLHGLLNPIVITADRELIAGNRRLESAKRLGWLSIDAMVLSDPDEIEKLQIEIDENIHRRPLTPDELADAYERLEKLQTPPLLIRIWRRIVAFFRRLFRIDEDSANRGDRERRNR